MTQRHTQTPLHAATRPAGRGNRPAAPSPSPPSLETGHPPATPSHQPAAAPDLTTTASDLSRGRGHPGRGPHPSKPLTTREYYADGRVRLLLGDALAVLGELPDSECHCVVTSPPYYWTRDYGIPGQYGLDATPPAVPRRAQGLFAQVHRVLARTGTAWLNLGDSYSQRTAVRASSHQDGLHGSRGVRPTGRELRAAGRTRMSADNLIDDRPIAEKSLLLLPERLLVALLDDGWLLRAKIVWSKTVCLPDPAADRPARRWEPLFLLTKNHRYFYDTTAAPRDDIWHLPASRGAGTHAASYPVDLPQRCIAAGCPDAGAVLDPFSGSGTTGLAAQRLHRHYLGIDLRPDYHDLALQRLGLRRPHPANPDESQKRGEEA